jgi:hypothetical protein
MNRKLLISFVPLLVVAAFAVTPVTAQAATVELGRCIKKTVAGGTGYSNAGCTTPTTGVTAKYEWLPGPGAKNKFTSTEHASTFATLLGKTMTCESDTDAGEYIGASEDRETITFKGCKSAGIPCTSVGLAAGEVQTNELISRYGFVKAPKSVGVSLEPGPKSGGDVLTAGCGALTIEIRGSVIAPVPIDKMVLTFTEKFVAAKGKQKPENFEGQPKDVLESSFAKAAFEQTGFTSADTVTNEEKLEIRVTPEAPKWWVEEALLVGAEPIAEETKVTVNLKLEFSIEKGVSKIKIECKKEKIDTGIIEGPRSRSEQAEIFEECGVVGEESKCSVASSGSPAGTIKTSPLTASLEGASGAAKLKFEPEAGKPIAAYEISEISPTCADKGFKFEADGNMICNYKGVQTESLEHPLEFTPTSGSKFTLGGGEGKLTLTDEVHLSSAKKWSAF